MAVVFKKESKDKPFTKPLFEALDPINTLDQANVLLYGAKRYGLNNWKLAKLHDLHHYLGAAKRHLNAYERGEGIDLESDLPHLAHLQVNAMFLEYFRRKAQWATTY